MSAPVNKGPFEEALDQFRASLAPQEQSIFTQCSSPEELIRHVENLDSIKKIQKRGAFMRRVKIFSDSLRHYFDVIGILVQSHPEYAALAWGAFRLVLQLASNFGEFFDKLTNTLLRLSEVLPWYEDLASSLMGTRKNFSWPYQASSRLVASLTKIYVDLFVFLQSVVRVFTKKDTSNRSSVVIFSSLFWKPYDARFQDVLDSMKHHRELLTTELSLYGHQTTHVNLAKEKEDLKKELQGLRGVSKKQQDRCEEIRRRLGDLAAMIANSTRNSRTLEISLSKISNNIAAQIEKFKKEIDSKLRTQMKASLEDRIHRWLSAPAYANDLVKARKERENGTSEWFFDEHRFQQWLRVGADDLNQLVSNRFRNNTLWVQGNPGFGKTIIAGAVIDELEWRVPTASPIFYFFFRQEPTLDNSTAAYRSLLTQILNKCKRDEIFDKFAFGIGYSPSGQPTGTQTELFELIQLCAELIGPHYIVLDGIDECSDKNELIFDLTKLGPKSKLILFSRPNVKFLREKTTQDQQIDIGRSNTDDIQMFLERRLTELAQRDMLLEGANIQKYTLHLTDGADGMFLWAKLMTDYLESDAWSDQDRHDTIVAIAMPERLSVMYLRIIKLICLGLSHEKKMAKWIIMWLTFALRPLTASELEESVKLLNENPQAKPGRRDFAKAVVMICACLVEKATLYDDYGKEQVYFRFIHSTVKGYFVNLFTEAGMSKLPGDIRSDVASIATSTPHMEICRSCLQYMLFHMPAQSLGEALKNSVESQITVADLETAFPFSGYVTVLWTNHLRRTKDELFARSGPDCVYSDSTRNLFDALAQFLAKNPVVRVWIEVTYTMGLNHDRSIDALRAWSDDVKAKRAKFGDSNAKITSVLSTVDALIHYLPELDKYWGSPLKDCPGRIWAWDEVHAFTPSQFSDKSSTTVHSLFAGDPQQAGITLSKRYLCKISESTPRFVGTLSVWSSRAFESFHDGKPQFSQFLKDESVTGWMARYEIWSIDESPKRLLIKDIFLEASEVRLQLLQSLRVDTGASVPKWKVQFPVTVSSDLQRLTILRTVYWLEPLKGKSEGRMRSALLDLSLEPYSTAKWNELCYDRDQATRKNSIALYTYWIRFSKAGNYIFFMDRNNTAVFSLRPNENKGPILTAFAGGQNFGDKDNEPLRQLDVQFHPQKPLVAYRTGRKVFLWVFKNSHSQPKLCYETPSGHLSFPEHITFTSNSEQLVIKEHNCELPIVMSLPIDILNALENENVVCVEEDEDEEGQSGSVLAERPTLDLWSFKSASLELVSGAYVQTQSSGESLGFTPFHSRNDAGITLWQNTTNGFQQQRFEIVKFPAWEGISTVSTSVKLPEPGHSDVTLVLNKAVQSDNFFGKAQPERFPAIIRREVTSLRPLPVEEAKSHGKRLQKSAEEQRKKRPRFASIGEFASIGGFPSTDGFASVGGLTGVDGFTGADGFNSVDGFAGINWFPGIEELNTVGGVTSVGGLTNVDRLTGIDESTYADGLTGVDGFGSANELKSASMFTGIEGFNCLDEFTTFEESTHVNGFTNADELNYVDRFVGTDGLISVNNLTGVDGFNDVNGLASTNGFTSIESFTNNGRLTWVDGFTNADGFTNDDGFNVDGFTSVDELNLMDGSANI